MGGWMVGASAWEEEEEDERTSLVREAGRVKRR